MANIAITGAGRGIALELVRQYAANGDRVFALCRNPESAKALNELAAASGGKITVHKMDVASDESVKAGAATTGSDQIDVLLNVAGVLGPVGDELTTADWDGWNEAFNINTCGPLRTLQAFLIAAAVGMPLGVLLGSNERAYRSVEFLIDFFRSTPSSALIPLFLMIFGVSDINKVAIAAFGALLIVLFNSAYGVINARKQRVMAARVMGATRWQVFRDVLVWESLQPSFVGLRSAVSMALVIVIVAEMFIGSENGLGHRIINSQQVMNVRDMYASILSAGALGYALNVLFLVIEKRIVHWSGR